MTRTELLDAIKQISREIDAAENRTDRDAARSSRDPDTQSETDRRIRESARELADLRARKDALSEMGSKSPVTGEAARAGDALADMRRMLMLDGAPVQEISCAALVAIAEQLALLNSTLADELSSISESQRDIARAAIGF